MADIVPEEDLEETGKEGVELSGDGDPEEEGEGEEASNKDDSDEEDRDSNVSSSSDSSSSDSSSGSGSSSASSHRSKSSSEEGSSKAKKGTAVDEASTSDDAKPAAKEDQPVLEANFPTYTDDDVARFALRIPYSSVVPQYSIVVNSRSNTRTTYQRFMERGQAGWIEWARELAQTTEGYALRRSQKHVTDKKSGRVLTLEEFMDQLEEQAKSEGAPVQHRRPAAQLESPNIRNEEPSHEVLQVSEQKVYTDEEIRWLIDKTEGEYVFSSDPLFPFVFRPRTNEHWEVQKWITEQMAFPNLGWRVSVRELALSRGCTLDPNMILIHDSNQEKSYTYQQYWEMCQRESDASRAPDVASLDSKSSPPAIVASKRKTRNRSVTKDKK
jgi:hypothetical protein